MRHSICHSMEEYSDSDREMSYSPSLYSGSDLSSITTGPYAKIVEQPAKCGVRFRYECEGRISGAIPGVNTTTISPTYPKIKVYNYEGRAKVVVSCVTKTQPYRPHPHNLVGKKSAKDGICVMYMDGGDMTCSFNNLGILCAKRKDIRERLKIREMLKVDPFGTGFAHKSQAFKMIDLAVVRLCFQVFLEGPVSDQFDVQLEPVVSEPIYDKKAMSELSIAKLSHYSAYCTGGTEVILLCDRVIKDDIQIRFFEERDDRLIWEDSGEFKAADIHKHFAISFRTPKYCDETIQTPISVNIQLRRPSDGGTSESLPFYMLPKQDYTANKRQRISALPYRNHFRSSIKNHVIDPLSMPTTTMTEDVFVPRTQMVASQQQQEYILPRLLCPHTLHGTHDVHPTHDDDTVANVNDFIDFDLQTIGLIEENDLSIIGVNDHYWNCEIKDVASLANSDYKAITASTADDSVILDISANTASSVNQWSENPIQKHYLCA